MLARNRLTDTLCIVDEASMITDGNERDSLLLHLVRYVYSAPGCTLMFVGDVAQLPPVGHEGSPAMEPNRLRQLGLTPWSISLTQTMRQGENSGILLNATLVRQALYTANPVQLTLRARGFSDVEVVSSYDLADTLASSSSAKPSSHGTVPYPIWFVFSSEASRALSDAVRSCVDLYPVILGKANPS